MTPEQFEALREWIDHRGHLSAMIRQARNDEHAPKRIASLHNRIREVDEKAKGLLVCVSNS